MHKMIHKKLKISNIRRIISVYKNREIDCFPCIINYSLLPKKSWVEFEWLEGDHVTESDLNEAFYTLGKMHKTCSIRSSKNSVYTVCHGDVHKNNIIKNGNKIMFIDTSFTHLGWNYTDMDYVDLYDLFDKEKYPWIIKDNGLLESYFEGLGINITSREKESFRKKAAVYALKKYIKNGTKNNINITYEKKCLEKLINSTGRLGVIR